MGKIKGKEGFDKSMLSVIYYSVRFYPKYELYSGRCKRRPSGYIDRKAGDCLNQVLGQIGGFMMLVLIVVLACQFAADMGWIAYRTTLRRFYGLGILAVAVGAFQLAFGGLVYNLAVGQTNVFALGTIWKDAGVQSVIGNGTEYSLYPLLNRFLGKIMLGENTTVAFYISISCGICITWCLYLLLYKNYSRRKLCWCIMAVLLFPGSFYLFLPTKVTLWLCFSLWELVWLQKKKTIPAAVFAFLAMGTSLFGVISVGFFIWQVFFEKESPSGMKCLAVYTVLLAVSLLLQMVLKRPAGYERLLLLLPYLYIPMQSEELERHGNWMTFLWIMLAAGNGFLMCLR